jgi:maltooligosyltrehalose trehalohydrolase
VTSRVATAVRRTQSHHPVFGAVPRSDGVRFRLWAPDARAVRLRLRRADGSERTIELARGDRGLWASTVEEATAGDRYAYVVDDVDPRPDPASRFQPDGVHGWSEIVDPAAYRWADAGWAGLDPRHAVIYELHVGAFTPAGTFRAAIEKLPHLRDLGVTAIELMPLADFAGRRNWGYDGVALFAPSRAYGRPDDLRALVDAAHRAGLAVLVDVVYNHLGPEGAYLPALSPRFLTTKHETPWGAAVNLDDEGSDSVRRLIVDNALHWIHEYHADGLRLDATHALVDNSPRHIVAEVVAAVHAATDPPPLVFAEDHRNLARMVEPAARGGWDLDGVWADDFHHVVRRMIGGGGHGYFVDYRGDAPELADTLRRGWLYTGQQSTHHNAPRGTDPSGVAMRRAVICVENHDQVGNRARGDRPEHSADPAAWRAAVTVLLTAPMTPLLFMGQEWAASSPFLFFTDFGDEIGLKVVAGRRREFEAFPEFAAPDAAERIPDPQADDTFEASRLRWDELGEPAHAAVLALHRELLRLRREHPSLQSSDARECAAHAIDADTIAFRRDAPGDASMLVVARLRGSGTVAVPPLAGSAWTTLLTTEDRPFTADPRPPRVDPSGSIEFQRPGAVLFSGPRS